LVLDPDLVRALVARRRAADPLQRLSERERAVLTLMAEGRSNAGIAARLYLSPKSVERNVAAVFDKLGLPPDSDDNRRVLAVIAFLRAPAGPARRAQTWPPHERRPAASRRQRPRHLRRPELPRGPRLACVGHGAGTGARLWRSPLPTGRRRRRRTRGPPARGSPPG